MHKPQRYSLINLAESIRRGGDIKAAKYERGLSGMILDVYETAHGRPGAAIPTVAMQRDLEIGAIDGGGALSAESVLPSRSGMPPQDGAGRRRRQRHHAQSDGCCSSADLGWLGVCHQLDC